MNMLVQVSAFIPLVNGGAELGPWPNITFSLAACLLPLGLVLVSEQEGGVAGVGESSVQGFGADYPGNDRPTIGPKDGISDQKPKDLGLLIMKKPPLDPANGGKQSRQQS
jgi:hypothetical protein